MKATRTVSFIGALLTVIIQPTSTFAQSLQRLSIQQFCGPLALSPDGTRVVLGGCAPSPSVLVEITTARRSDISTRTDFSLDSVVFSHDGALIGTRELNASALSGDMDHPGMLGAYRLRDGYTGREIATLEESRNALVIDSWHRPIAFSPRGRTFGAAFGMRLHIWRTDQPLQEAERWRGGGYDSMLSAFSFSPDGQHIVYAQGLSIGLPHAAFIGDLQSGRDLAAIQYNSLVFALSFSPDGTRFASGTTNGGVSVWDARIGSPEFGAQLLTLSDDTGREGVSDLAFSPNGDLVVAAFGSTRIVVWESRTGHEVAALRGQAFGFLQGAVVIANGNTVEVRRASSLGLISTYDAGTSISRIAAAGGIIVASSGNARGVSDAHLLRLADAR